MLAQDLKQRATKGRFTAEPFVDQHAQGILIAGSTRFALNLFWSHVYEGACLTLRRERVQTLLDDCDAKITEHDFIVSGEQHILRFDIAVDHALLMGIV